MTKTLTVTAVRQAGKDGDILAVQTLNSGAKVLVDFADRDEVVELQLHRRVRLVALPTYVQKEFGVCENPNAIHISIPYVGNANGFSFDGSSRHAVCIQSLPDGQVVHVLPEDILPMAAALRLPVPRPELASRVAAYAYA